VRKHEEKVKESLSESQYKFFKDNKYSVDMTIYSEFVAAMRNPDITPSEYISKKLGWLFDVAIPNHQKDVVMYFADKLQEYPYSYYYGRRPFRAKDKGFYSSKLVNIIQEYNYVIDEPLENILNMELSEESQAYLDEYAWHGCGYTGWQVAYALDHNDSKVEDAVRRILTDENGSKIMTNELVRGIIFSHRSDFHELLGKLLLAARLQEGLRQAICQNADCGTKAAFLTILKVIAENNLVRFSSVKRAVGIWLGIFRDDPRDFERVSEKSVRLIINCLENESVREECLTSEDAMKIYIALWSYAFYDIEEAINKSVYIANNGSTHQLVVLGYFVMILDLPYISNRIAKTVLNQHYNNDEVLAVWLSCFMPTLKSDLVNAERNAYPIQCSKSEIHEYYQLIKKLYSDLCGKKKLFSQYIFPWYQAEIKKNDFAEIICILAAILGDNEKIDEACILIKECNYNQRQFYFSVLLREPKTPIQRKTVLEGLADKEKYTRKAAYDIVSKLELSCEDYCFVEEYLRFKNSDIRKYVMGILLKQSDLELTSCISRLLENSKEEVRLAGLDMLLQLKKDEKRSNIADSFTSILLQRTKSDNFSSKEKGLIDSLILTKAEKIVLFSADDKYLPTEFDKDYIELCAKTFENYFPESKLPELIREKNSVSDIFKKNKSEKTDTGICNTYIVADNDLMALSKLIEEHKTDPFTCSDGRTKLIGNVQHWYQFIDKDGKLPFMELWHEWIETNGITNKRLVSMLVLNHAYTQKTHFSEACVDSIRTVFGTGFEYGKELPYSDIIEQILNHMLYCLAGEETTHLAAALTIWFMKCVPEDMVMICAPTERMSADFEIAHLLAHQQLCILYGWLKNSSDLKNTFPLSVASAERCLAAFRKKQKEEPKGYYIGNSFCRILNRPYVCTMYNLDWRLVGVKEYLIAAYRGIISEAQLFEFLLDSDNISESMEVVTAVASNYYEKGRQIYSRDSYKCFYNTRKVKEFIGKNDELSAEDIKLIEYVFHIYETIIPVVLACELNRGDSPTIYSKGIYSIVRIYGVKYFSKILSAMGDDTFERTKYYSSWTVASDRRDSLSYLLSVCIPADEDSADTLRAALLDKKITTKRMIEAALFSPEWIPIIGKYLEIESFELVCYYFIAHMKEEFDDKRKAMIARFSHLSADELHLGAFDVNWFRSAYDSIDEEKFNLIYDAAKYISDGAKHSRARKYADATLGKFNADEIEKMISDKRNKDLLMAYALIPLNSEDDILRRYLYIQRFRKESKQFGSQRVESEGKAVEMALVLE